MHARTHIPIAKKMLYHLLKYSIKYYVLESYKMFVHYANNYAILLTVRLYHILWKQLKFISVLYIMITYHYSVE